MQKPEILDNEVERLKALRRYKVLDTLPEREFDELTQLASLICETPIALISLVDRDRQWFKAKVGIDAEETSRDISFCGHVVASSKMLIVEDATQDTRFADNPLVLQEPKIRFYAGAPLITSDGFVLGTLCTIDLEPKTLSPTQIKHLESLSNLVISQLELRIKQENSQLLTAVVECSSDAIITMTLEGVINSWNPAAEKLFGYTQDEAITKNISILFTLERSEHSQLLAQIKQGEGLENLNTVLIHKNATEIDVSLTLSPLKDQRGKAIGISIIVRNLTDRIIAEVSLKRSNDLLSCISKAQSQFITAANRLTIFEDLLSSLLDLTNSEYGLIGEVLFRQDGSAFMEDSLMKIRGVPYLKTHGITNISWDDTTQKFYEENYKIGMEFTNMQTLFGATIMTGQPVIANNPSTDPRRGGVPDGHPPLNAFLGLPFYKGSQLIGMVGIANRPNGYDQELIEYLQPFLVTCSNLIEGYRLERQRNIAESARTMAERKKEILLKEVHHRVKNNLMIVGSLLNWQGESVQDPKLLSILEDSKKRINSIALIHEKLYRSPDLAKIDFGEYLHSLVQQIFATFSLSNDRVRLRCEVASIFLNIETATPCGLIINELVSNALEHAFPEHRSGELFVSLSHDEKDQIILMVADDGVGFPKGVDFRQTESLGWQLVCLLTEQLEGDVQLFRESGTRVVVSFSELNYQWRF
ncbi:histidine kinase dimerization/phosphoacceptor domain -containing protein [Pseudanabaena yagii]|uniref:histidine kinase n=1 Tax=Pseudanabaena yagii GIHE-NHR1 TaxID=2722753 RepID=A0ABX1LQF6_9CYAN|nr:histidine kinase dimerization/phosphoacceptor domain -containing protein [Pseudanabaena yagii]NMF57281.1 GAF domain-containing protein [Pseudanabaena yagii GIHE-NHR1]